MFVRYLRNINNSRGFLLVDAIVGIMVITIGLASLAALFMQGTRVRGEAEAREKAVQYAAELVEVARERRYGSGADIEVFIDVVATGEAGTHKYGDVTYHGRVYMSDNMGIPTDFGGENLRAINSLGFESDVKIYPVIAIVNWGNAPLVLDKFTGIGTGEPYVAFRAYVELD